MMDKKEAIEIIKEAVKGNARKEDFFKTPNEIIGDVLDEYAEAINKNSVIPDVSDYYYLQDGDDVKNGDEYYDYDTVQDWVTIKDQVGTYKHDSETCYKTRRKI